MFYVGQRAPCKPCESKEDGQNSGRRRRQRNNFDTPCGEDGIRQCVGARNSEKYGGSCCAKCRNERFKRQNCRDKLFFAGFCKKCPCGKFRRHRVESALQKARFRRDGQERNPRRFKVRTETYIGRTYRKRKTTFEVSREVLYGASRRPHGGMYL